MIFKDHTNLESKLLFQHLIQSLKTPHNHDMKFPLVLQQPDWDLVTRSCEQMDLKSALALGRFLEKVLDTPPNKGYAAGNNNSLLDWSQCN